MHTLCTALPHKMDTWPLTCHLCHPAQNCCITVVATAIVATAIAQWCMHTQSQDTTNRTLRAEQIQHLHAAVTSASCDVQYVEVVPVITTRHSTFESSSVQASLSHHSIVYTLLPLSVSNCSPLHVVAHITTMQRGVPLLSICSNERADRNCTVC
jgi:hypothetical protein